MSSRVAGGAEEVWIGRLVAASSSLRAGEQAETRVAGMTNQARRRSRAPVMIDPVYRDAAGLCRAGIGAHGPQGRQPCWRSGAVRDAECDTVENFLGSRFRFSSTYVGSGAIRSGCAGVAIVFWLTAECDRFRRSGDCRFLGAAGAQVKPQLAVQPHENHAPLRGTLPCGSVIYSVTRTYRRFPTSTRPIAVTDARW